jgi:predicted ATPase
LFIPAGRSFFTTVGKAIVAFEHAGMLDPVTQQFGRLFTSLRENRSAYYRRSEKLNSDFIKELVKQFFGGTTIRFDRDDEYIETSDGRKLTFPLLSSGQQELLPLWMTLNAFFGPHYLIFIEEPEAHLFPSGLFKFTPGELCSY